MTRTFVEKRASQEAPGWKRRRLVQTFMAAAVIAGCRSEVKMERRVSEITVPDDFSDLSIDRSEKLIATILHVNGKANVLTILAIDGSTRHDLVFPEGVAISQPRFSMFSEEIAVVVRTPDADSFSEIWILESGGITRRIISEKGRFYGAPCLLEGGRVLCCRDLDPLVKQGAVNNSARVPQSLGIFSVSDKNDLRQEAPTEFRYIERTQPNLYGEGIFLAGFWPMERVGSIAKQPSWLAQWESDQHHPRSYLVGPNSTFPPRPFFSRTDLSMATFCGSTFGGEVLLKVRTADRRVRAAITKNNEIRFVSDGLDVAMADISPSGNTIVLSHLEIDRSSNGLKRTITVIKEKFGGEFQMNPDQIRPAIVKNVDAIR